MKKIIIVILIIIFITFFFIFIQHKKQNSLYKQLIVNNNIFLVEIADSPKKREAGLSYRQHLPKGQGMLFIFQKTDFHNFWMKGMNFPLDFIWINGDNIVDISENVKPLQEDEIIPTIYSPKYQADKVLEINAGTIKELDIKVGDKIKLF